MPYGRKNKKKMSMRRRYSRRPFSRKQVKAIRKISEKSGELKCVKATTNDTSLTNTSGVQHSVIGTITQGDGQDAQRIGDKITVKDLQVRVSLKSGTANGLVRVYLYQVKGDLANFGGALNDLYPQSFFPDMNDTNGNTYKILFDRVYKLAPDIAEDHFVKLNIKGSRLLRKVVEFDNDASTVIDGDIKLGIETDNTTATQMTADVDSRLRYYG